MSELREGDRICNYLLQAPIGKGSFGEVWRAKHHIFDDVVAIKIPTDAQFVRNLQREGVAVHGLRHPNIVRVIDLDPYASPPYLVMEYIEGPSLRTVIDEYEDSFPIPAAVAITRGILRALTAAHEAGLIHRDVKPANILLNHPIERLASITEEAVKITDFGLGLIGGVTTRSIMQSGSLQTEEGRSIAGTLAYMAPEQKDGGEVDGRGDLYSCGIVLFEMLTGERPHGGDLPSLLRKGVPPQLDQVFRQCYIRKERRFASAQDMLGAMDRSVPATPPLSSGARMAGHACPSCRTAVEPGDQFCIKCGQQLVDSVPRCEACKAFVHHNDRFCIFCGHDLRVMA